ncbi:response regulator [uncultured Phenylobacterium sp.]|uniref:response regulator n=1 Tax=uncultured Phenylobacterium sp. TaxID=349273 RepID=UPI0025D1CB69|nr:response regulator [uncultured Phenylobacterium sp.]
MTPDTRDLILVVDDDAETRDMLAAGLRQAQFNVLPAADGQSALALAAQARPGLVVLDAVMPGMSGFEVCRRMKANPDLAHLPVIFLTGLAETEHVIEGLHAGGVDYVTKPIILDELAARISVHLATARIAHSARVALDVAGRAMLATDGAGRLLWRTPQTEAMLAALGPNDGDGLPSTLGKALCGLIQRRHEAGIPSARIESGAATLEVAYVGGADDASYFRLSQLIEGREANLLRSALGLTIRESEVLVWIAAGKSNRDISEILGISPRTVNKHLEQVFTKLGVENRAAAAAIATRVISN